MISRKGGKNELRWRLIDPLASITAVKQPAFAPLTYAEERSYGEASP
jgi:hypothetical protein